MLTPLQERWIKFSSRMALPKKETIWKNFTTLYTEDNRHYHDLKHILDCLTKLDTWPQHLDNTDRDTIELAIWFHDIIYDSRRADNEESSAALVSHYLKGHPLTENCKTLILATRHKQTKGTHTEEIICDIDLSILGAEPEKYQLYANNIRKEYSWAAIEDYNKGRARVLHKFLTRESLFKTSYATEKWKEQAHINIKNELKKLL